MTRAFTLVVPEEVAVFTSWLAGQVLERTMDSLNRGDVAPTVRLESPDVRFRFPGRSSWSGEIVGRDNVAAWLRRMVDTGIVHRVDEVVATGSPWRTTIVLRGRDHRDGSDGTRVYDNRYVIWAHARWGRITDYEVYEDTERTAAFDRWLEEHAAVAATSGSAPPGAA
jgi:ketosteroid isomerase-like protein